MLALIVLVVQIVLIVLFIRMSNNVLDMCDALNKIERYLRPKEAEPSDDGGESYKGYQVSGELLNTVRNYKKFGADTAAVTELCRGANMPEEVAKEYLEQL